MAVEQGLGWIESSRYSFVPGPDSESTIQDLCARKVPGSPVQEAVDGIVAVVHYGGILPLESVVAPHQHAGGQ